MFSLGLSATVAPLTATVLADADEEHAGIASGVNNAIARAAGLLGVAAIGAVIAAQFAGELNDRIDPSTLSPEAMAVVRVAEERALVRADVSGLPPQEGAQVARRGRGGVGQRLPHRHGDQRHARRPRRDPRPRPRPHAPPPRRCAEDCAGGQLVAAPADAVRERVPVAGAGLSLTVRGCGRGAA